jgi:hypothetical protein
MLDARQHECWRHHVIAALLDFLDMQMTFRRFDWSVSLVHWMMG